MSDAKRTVREFCARLPTPPRIVRRLAAESPDISSDMFVDLSGMTLGDVRITVADTCDRALAVLPASLCGSDHQANDQDDGDTATVPGDRVGVDGSTKIWMKGGVFDPLLALREEVNTVFARAGCDTTKSDGHARISVRLHLTAAEDFFAAVPDNFDNNNGIHPLHWRGCRPPETRHVERLSPEFVRVQECAYLLRTCRSVDGVSIEAKGVTHQALHNAVQFLAQCVAVSGVGPAVWNGGHSARLVSSVRVQSVDVAAVSVKKNDVTSFKQQSFLPLCEIQDWPDFTQRGFMLDVSRSRVPTMDALFELVDLLSFLKYNELQLYLEHTFAYTDHEDVWTGSSPLTSAEIQRLDVHCAQKFIQLVPNQNSLGHLHQFLKHDRYKVLAERPEGMSHPFSLDEEPFSLNPLAPEVDDFIDGLYKELLPNFSSRIFNVGLDEAFDLGTGQSQLEALSRVRSGLSSNGNGSDVLFVEYLLRIHEKLRNIQHQDMSISTPYTMQFWADMLLQFSEKYEKNSNARLLLERIPQDGTCIALVWGYEAASPLEQQCNVLAKCGVPFYVCPGTSSWTSITGRTDNAVMNVFKAAKAGLSHGAIGLLQTDWGDAGHLQPFEVSHIGIILAAAHAWNHNAAPSPTDAADRIPSLLDDVVYGRCRHVDHSDAAFLSLGDFAYTIGNSYQNIGRLVPNCNAVFWTLAHPHGLHTMPGIEIGARMLFGKVGVFVVSSVGKSILGAVGRLWGFNESLLRKEIDAVESLKFHALKHACVECHGEHTIRCWLWCADLLQFALELAIHRQKVGLNQPAAAIPASVRHHLAMQLEELLIEHRVHVRPVHSRPGGLHESHRALSVLLRQLQRGDCDTSLSEEDSTCSNDNPANLDVAVCVADASGED